MARALLVGCGCRGRMLGAGLAAAGLQVRGTSRNEAGRDAIEAAGIEAADADPLRPGTVLELVGDVAVVLWLLGSASGAAAELEDLHGARLEHLLARLVDTPVRGFVYEARGSVPDAALETGAQLVAEAGQRWRIPSRLLAADPDDPAVWMDAGLAAVGELLGGAGASG